MRIKAKILWTFLGICLLAALVGSREIGRQRAIGILNAADEAEEDARVLGFIAANDPDPAHAISQKVASYMYGTLGREVEVMDTRKRVIAGAIPTRIGSPGTFGGDVIDRTLRDGQVRTFSLTVPDHPAGLHWIVAPMTNQSGRVLGAVIEEYTPIYSAFMAITAATTRQVVVAALAGIAISVLLSLYIGISVGRPLGQLTRAAAAFAAGETGLPMPPPRNDEIGELTAAFTRMVQKRSEAGEALERARDALAAANARLHSEVSERRLAEQTALRGEERVRQMADELAGERRRLADILDSVPAVVFEHWSLGDSRRNFVSSYVETMYGYTSDEWLSTPDFWTRCVHPEDRDQVIRRVAGNLNKGDGGGEQVFRWITRDNRVVWGETHITVIRNPIDGTTGVRGFTVDVTERRQAEEKLAELHRQLLDASRAAGMAEVATAVLHNVGNVLNSVNVSATLAMDLVRQSSAPHLGRVAALLGDNAENLGAFLAADPAGRKLPAFLGQLAEQLAAEHAAILTELEQLGRNVEHIKDIVAVQQSYSNAAGVSQTVEIVELVEDSLRMNAGALARHDVQLVRDFEARPVIEVDKHKVMQILINLIRNAKYACDDSDRPDKCLTVRIAGDDRAVRISVIDNGVGIPPENLTRIFSHGFTTRAHGHGFGLHSGALAARELGGALLVRSDGPGRGAMFTLELPFHPDEH
jgi:PAS domain S-box-containing protein